MYVTLQSRYVLIDQQFAQLAMDTSTSIEADVRLVPGLKPTLN